MSDTAILLPSLFPYTISTKPGRKCPYFAKPAPGPALGELCTAEILCVAQLTNATLYSPGFYIYIHNETAIAYLISVHYFVRSISKRLTELEAPRLEKDIALEAAQEGRGVQGVMGRMAQCGVEIHQLLWVELVAKGGQGWPRLRGSAET